jgi:ACS family hexuronate transporter-like MFS transporter
VVWIVLKTGWREAFFVVGAIGLVWALVWSLVYHVPPEVEKEECSTAVSVRQLFRTRFVWSFTLAKIFLDPVWYFYIFWFPTYLKQARHFDLASIGRYAWIPFMVAGLGNLLGGWLAGSLLRRNISITVARKSGVTLFALLMLSAIPAVLTPSASSSIVLVSVAMLGYTGVTANLLAFPADVFPKSVVATIWGLASMGSGFGGMVFALMTGWLVDRYSYVPVFIGFSLIPMIALLIIWFVLGPLRPASLPSYESATSHA